MAQREFRQIYPAARLGRARSARDLELAARDRARGARQGRPRRRPTSPAIGITNQRETTLRLEPRAPASRSRNAIVWQDRRTAPACEALKARGLEPLFRERTGLVLDAYFSGTKLAWLLDHVPGARAAARARRARLRHRRHLADLAAHRRREAATAGRGPRHRLEQRLAHAALRHATRRLERRAAARCSTSRATVLPEVHPSSHVFGHTDGRPVRRADRRSAASPATSRARCSARRCFRPGQVKNTYGTGCFMLMNTGARFEVSANGLIATSAAQAGGAGRSTRSKAASSSAAPSCSGCATA